jgi:hypothetical protein
MVNHHQIVLAPLKPVVSRAGGILKMEAGDDESGVPPVGQPRRSL